MSSSAVPIYGLALFRPLYGSKADALVGMVALTTNLAQISVAVFLLEASGPSKGANAVMGSIFNTIQNPLVLSPIVGAMMVMLGIHLPDVLIQIVGVAGKCCFRCRHFCIWPYVSGTSLCGKTGGGYRNVRQNSRPTGNLCRVTHCLWDQ